MSNNIQWHIGKEGTTSSRLDTGPYRAYFFWTSNGTLTASADYSVEELRDEVLRRTSDEPEAAAFLAALHRLESL